MKRAKANIEFLLVKAELNGIPEKGLLKSRNIGQVDLIWPRTGVAKKSGAREMAFRRGTCDFTAEPWTKRVVFREEVEDRCGLAVSITEPVSVQKVRRFLRLTAKYALKMDADFMEKAMVGYADIASSPIDALAAMIGEKDVPKVIAAHDVVLGVFGTTAKAARVRPASRSAPSRFASAPDPLPDIQVAVAAAALCLVPVLCYNTHKIWKLAKGFG